MKFVVATYGARHIGMLLAHLQSIRESHPQAAVEIYHQDLPEPQRAAIAGAFPQAVWVATNFNFTGDRIQRISSKTLAWELALQRQPAGECVCLLDVDTLVRLDLQPFFAEEDCDIVFTFKNDGFVLNTGVLLCRAGPRATAFAARWRELAIGILGNSERFQQANDPKLPYGAADQMALHEMLQYRDGQARYEVEIGAKRVRFRGESCELLNETRSCPMTARTHLVHFKGGWQPILLDGRRFSRNRPKAGCWEMYTWYLDTFHRALASVCAASPGKWSPGDFHVRIPTYISARAPLAHALGYGAFVAWDHVRDGADFVQGVKRVFLRTLRGGKPTPK